MFYSFKHIDLSSPWISLFLGIFLDAVLNGIAFLLFSGILLLVNKNEIWWTASGKGWVKEERHFLFVWKLILQIMLS